MDNKYFDTWEFRKAISFFDTNPIEANKKLEEYLKKYPKDYSAASYYGSNLITLGQFEKGYKFLLKIEKDASKDPQFQTQRSKKDALRRNLVYGKLRYFAYMEMYDKLYEFYLKNQKVVEEELEVNDVMFYCASKLGKLEVEKRETNSYLFRQIVEYRESDFMDHVKKHLADCNVDKDNPNKNVFMPNFPIEKVVEEIKKYIPSDKRICTGFIENSYYFKYDRCGKDTNKAVDYFKVICFNNTSNIITICPVNGYQNLPYVDLNYMVEEKADFKRMSQLEKFNRRLKRN